MPSISDYDKSDEDSGGLSDGYTPAQSAAVGSATGAPKQATPTKQQDDGYVPWSSFVSANQDVSQREAGKLSGQVQGDVTKAQGDLSSAQSGFNNGIASNYNTPTPKAPKASGKSTTPGAEQNQAPATSATSTAATTGSAPDALSRGPAPTSTAATPRTALDGANTHLQSSSQPVAQNRATPVGATDNRVTSQNPSAFTPATPPSSQPSQQANQTPNQSSPWSSFLPVNATQAGPSAAQSPDMGLANERVRSQQLGANAAANGAQGPHDLESATGQAGWGQLLGDTKKAQDEAGALGSESGVQGLLQQNASGPTNSAFDAALINGQGGPQFRQLAQKYGGNQLEQGVVGAEKASQDAWSQLQGDVATRQAFDAAKAGQQLVPGATPAATTATPAATAATPAPNDYDGFDMATQGYGQDRADKNTGSNPNKLFAYGSSNTGYGDVDGAPNGLNNAGDKYFNGGRNQSPDESINVGTKTDANGNTVADWSGWFGGSDEANQSPQDLGLTTQEIWSLSLMTPGARGAWLDNYYSKKPKN